jgi:hypothetical protein
MTKFQCGECGYAVKECAKNCKKCWAELIWKDEKNDKKQNNKNFLTLEDINAWGKWFKPTKTIKWHNFSYEKNEIFYKNDVPDNSRYRLRRILICIALLLCGVIPWIIFIIIIFWAWSIRPWEKCLLISDEWIWKIDQTQFSAKTKYFLQKSEIWEIILEWNKFIIKKEWKNSNYFSFTKILEVEKLKYSLKRHWYKFVE